MKIFKYSKDLRRKIGIWILGLFSFARSLKPVIHLLGPRFIRNPKIITLDITHSCNLLCYNCSRSCGEAPSDRKMTIDQIQKFIKESINRNMRWERIGVLGGEPCLHPNIFEILNLLSEYKKKFSPNSVLRVVTNGFGKKVNSVLTKIKEDYKDIEIKNSLKKSRSNEFIPLHIAPKDSSWSIFSDFSNGCSLLECGINLTPFGYYVCAPAGTIDRVLGSNYGRKKLPSYDDKMLNQLSFFCRFCGAFIYFKYVYTPKMSPTWNIMYDKYKEIHPNLTLY